MATLTSSEFYIENNYLKRYNSSTKKIVTVPDYITSIASLAFTNAKAMEIILPETLRTISRRSFAFCENLKYINIPEGIEDIPYDTFEGDINLTNIDVSLSNEKYSSEDGIIYNKDKTIVEMGFPSLKGCVTLKDNVLELGDNAFRICELLDEIILNDNLLSIGSRAFCNTQIKTIHLGPNVKYISHNAFFNCDTLETITVDDNNQYFTSVDGVLYTKDMKALVFVPNGKQGSLVIPDTVEQMTNDAFYNKQLSSITMPSLCSETTLPPKGEQTGRSLFERCPNLTEIVFSNKKLSITPNLFGYNLSYNKDIFVQYIKYAYPSQLKFNDKLKYAKYILPDVIASSNTELKTEWVKFFKRNIKKFYLDIIEDKEFCNNLCTLKAISLDAIRDITALSQEKNKIEITSELLEYQNENFSTEDVMNSTFNALNIDLTSRKYLKDIFIFHKKEDGTYIITGYKGKDTDILIPSTISGIEVTEIGKRAFSPKKSGLTSDDVLRINSITSITVPGTVKKIHIEAFCHCTNLKTLNLNYGLEEIYYDKYVDYGFCEGTKITELDIPGPIKSLPPYLFSNTRIKKLTLSDTITEIGMGCFQNCYYLEEINLPPITRIEASTFNGCSALKKLVIPDTVSFFGTRCFAYCLLLTAFVGEVVHKYEKEINYYAPSFQFACKENGRVWRTCDKINIKHVPL